MSLNRYNAKRDANERAIVKALRRAGAKVMLLNKFDLLVLYREQLFMFDAKVLKGRTTLTQNALIAEGWPLRLVRDELSALEAIGAIGPIVSRSETVALLVQATRGKGRP